MFRDYRVYLDDMQVCAEKALRYIQGMTYEEFVGDEKTFDALVRNLEIIGEAAKHVPEEVCHRYPGVQWQEMSGLRDIIAHEYFGLKKAVLWDIVQNHLPRLSKQLQEILAAEDRGEPTDSAPWDGRR